MLVVPRKIVAGGGACSRRGTRRPYATRALRWAREISRSLRSTLDVLYVNEIGKPIEKDESLGRRLVAALGTGSDWMLHKRAGDSREQIISAANSGRYELVVLSAHRRAFASDFVLGSAVERLLRHSKVPVLAVPSGRSRPRVVRRLAARVGARLY